MSKTGIIIQARVGSRRLPNKMILPFYDNKGVFELLLIKLLKVYNPTDIILATSISNKNDVLENIASIYDVKIFRGNEENVLSRFIQISEKYNYQNVIRICADNPFLLMDDVEKLRKEIENNEELDYVSFRVNKKPSILSHFGLWAEAIKVNALKKIEEQKVDSVYFEHVTNYIHTGNPEMFNIKLLNINNLYNGINDIRLTLDTYTDFKIQQQIYKALYKSNRDIKFEMILDYLEKQTELKILMKKEIIRNEK